MNYLITGTDTEIGKTYVTSLLLQDLRRRGVQAAGYKPVACGDRQDPRALRDASDPVMSLEEINPVYLRTPTAPHVAAAFEKTVIDPEILLAGYRNLDSKYEMVLVEGVGGWEVPMAPGMLFSDFACMLALPVILVVGNKLGAVNHAILTANAIRARGLECRGIVLNHLQEEWDTAALTNKALLQEFTGLSVLEELIYGQDSLDSSAVFGEE